MQSVRSYLSKRFAQKHCRRSTALEAAPAHGQHSRSDACDYRHSHGSHITEAVTGDYAAAHVRRCEFHDPVLRVSGQLFPVSGRFRGRKHRLGSLQSPNVAGSGRFHHRRKIASGKRQKILAQRCTSAQLALAWLLNRHDNVIPIPGTSSIKRMEENVRAADIFLSDEELDQVENLAPPGIAAGTRYDSSMMRLVNG
jgi:hypothetical protein